jgi:hypothetical protein
MFHNLSQFTVHFDNELSTDASELGYRPGWCPKEKLHIEGEPGDLHKFRFHRRLPNGGGWVFIPRDRHCPYHAVTIYND